MGIRTGSHDLPSLDSLKHFAVRKEILSTVAAELGHHLPGRAPSVLCSMLRIS